MELRTVKEPEERSQEILDTAVRLFCDNGYDQTSMADIAGAVGVSQGLCYRYFPSKEALFDAAIDRYADTLAMRMAAPMRECASLEELLDRLPLFTEVEGDGPDYRLMHGARSTHEQLFCRVCAKLMPLAVQVLRRAGETGEADVPDPEAAAAFCVYGQMGILMRDDLTPEEKRRRIRAFLPRVCGLGRS